MNTLADRLKQEMARCGLTQQQLADKAEMAQASVYKLVSGKAQESRKISRLASALGVNTDWLATGKGPKYKTIDISTTLPGLQGDASIEPNASYALALGEFSEVPVVGTAQLGDNGHWSELEYPVGHGDGHITYPTRDRNAYALRCRGDSMKPRIKDGEFVVVEPNSEAIPGDEILLKTHDGRVMVKTLLYNRDGKVHVMSVNEAHPPQSFDLTEVDKIHPVAAIVKKALWKD